MSVLVQYVVVALALVSAALIACGEPGARRDVDTTANALTSSTDELEHLADNLLVEFLPREIELPRTVGGRLLPIERLPSRFRSIGGFWNHDPELVLGEDRWAGRVMLSWGHLRHGVHIYLKPPAEPPTGFYVRKVSARVFVIANES